MTIKRIGPISCAKIVGVVYATIGLLVGAIVSLFAVIGLALSGTQQGMAERALSPLVGVALGLGAVIVFPIAYGIGGFIFALIGAWIYNLVASKVGGIEIDVS